jgi:hypothetical protein
MKKLICAIVVSVISITSGCSIYHAPWDRDQSKNVPVYKETKVYHSSAPVVNKNVAPAPVFKNENQIVEKKPVATKKAVVLKEKVITVKRPVKDEAINVTKNVVTDIPVKKEVLIIPIE